MMMNGKKTIIAAVILTLCAFGSQVVVDIWHYEPLWLLNAIKTGEWIGMMLGGTGLVHKVIKSKQQ